MSWNTRDHDLILHLLRRIESIYKLDSNPTAVAMLMTSAMYVVSNRRIVVAAPVNGAILLDEPFADDADAVATGPAPNADIMILPNGSVVADADGRGIVNESTTTPDGPRDIVFPSMTVAEEPGLNVMPLTKI